MKEKIRKSRKNMQGFAYEQVKNPEFCRKWGGGAFRPQVLCKS